MDDNFEESMDLFDEITTGADGFELGNLPRTDEIARMKNIKYKIKRKQSLT